MCLTFVRDVRQTATPPCQQHPEEINNGKVCSTTRPTTTDALDPQPQQANLKATRRTCIPKVDMKDKTLTTSRAAVCRTHSSLASSPHTWSRRSSSWPSIHTTDGPNVPPSRQTVGEGRGDRMRYSSAPKTERFAALQR